MSNKEKAEKIRGLLIEVQSLVNSLAENDIDCKIEAEVKSSAYPIRPSIGVGPKDSIKLSFVAVEKTSL